MSSIDISILQIISIHAPREGSDYRTAVYNTTAELFLSTLPARGATKIGAEMADVVIISIHAPREGSDSRVPSACAAHTDFYPRSPRGERQGRRGL